MAAIRAVHEASIRGLAPEASDRDQVEAGAAGVSSADYAAVDHDDYEFLVGVADDGADDVTEDCEERLVVDDGTVVAFGSLLFASSVDYESAVDAEVTGVYVHPVVARSGVGSSLLATLEARARETGVEMLGLTASVNAVPFYEARGYERVGERDHEFSASESTGVTGTVVEMRTEL